MATKLIGDYLDLYILNMLKIQNLSVKQILESVKNVNKINNAKSRIIVNKSTLYKHINNLKVAGKIAVKKGALGRGRKVYGITSDGAMWLASYLQNLG
ncbi:MAG: hypothetical protein J6V22_05470 [Clostridia bacterium]|nr:hypothetical protein [Clostridia bacterium]